MSVTDNSGNCYRSAAVLGYPLLFLGLLRLDYIYILMGCLHDGTLALEFSAPAHCERSPIGTVVWLHCALDRFAGKACFCGAGQRSWELLSRPDNSLLSVPSRFFLSAG
jgi:hypothetical protein